MSVVASYQIKLSVAWAARSRGVMRPAPTAWFAASRRRVWPRQRARRHGAAWAALLVAAVVLVPGRSLALPESRFYVSPSGSDANPGTRPTAPLATIQKALDRAGRGSVITLAPGAYRQDAVTRHAGVTITGPASATVKGAGSPRVLQARHDDITLEGFTVDGLAGDPGTRRSYRDKLIYVMAATPGQGISGLRIWNMTVRNAGGECIRLRYLVRGADVADNLIGPCGIHDFKFHTGKKNGEGIYLGTAPEQQGDNQAPDDRPDVSRDNHIHGNRIHTQAAECVDIKEHSTANLVENNSCTGQQDPDGSGFSARGSGNTFRNNRAVGNAGAGIRLGGDQPTDGTGNSVTDNELVGNLGGGIKFQAARQARICGNRLSANPAGDATGTYSRQFDPTTPCTGKPNLATSNSGGSTRAHGGAGAELPIASVTASGHDGHPPAATLDRDPTTRWSDKGNGVWISYRLRTPSIVAGLQVAFYKADQRQQRFDVQFSTDGVGWRQVFAGTSDPASPQPQPIDVTDTPARFVRIVGHGNTQNDWTSLNEVEIRGSPANAAPPHDGQSRHWLVSLVLLVAGACILVATGNLGRMVGRPPPGR